MYKAGDMVGAEIDGECLDREDTKNEKLLLMRATGNKWDQCPKEPMWATNGKARQLGLPYGSSQRHKSYSQAFRDRPSGSVLYSSDSSLLLFCFSLFQLEYLFHGHFISEIYNFLLISQGLPVKCLHQLSEKTLDLDF